MKWHELTYLRTPKVMRITLAPEDPMDPGRAAEIAARLMAEFARRTGLAPPTRTPQRYLWTDAFAVCNFLELHRRDGEPDHLALARALIDQVHHVLGRFRGDDARRGWLGGRSEDDGERHPTAGGLRIGKPLPERGVREPIDERLEWDRDGQYFHYLTKWMHALCQAAWVTGEAHYAQWAAELGRAAYDGFVRRSTSGAVAGLAWKMSTDLSRPLVAGMGLHDALDGYLSLREALQALAATRAPAVNFGAAIDSLRALCIDRDWTTDDPLGLGGLLFDADRLCQFSGLAGEGDSRLFDDLLAACARGLSAFRASRPLDDPVAWRLAFRELGLAIGLRALPVIGDPARHEKPGHPARSRAIDLLQRAQPLADEIVAAWLPQVQQGDETWRAHQDINEVMLASALIPDTFLAIGEPPH
jgi:hypothetical protein